jgi:hypothetical protein
MPHCFPTDNFILFSIAIIYYNFFDKIKEKQKAGDFKALCSLEFHNLISCPAKSICPGAHS